MHDFHNHFNSLIHDFTKAETRTRKDFQASFRNKIEMLYM